MGKLMQQCRRPGVLAALVFIGVLMVVAGYHFWNKPSMSAPPAKEADVQAETKPTGIVRMGSVEDPVFLPIHSGFSGRISEIYVTAGQAVKAGQSLFKLEAVSGNSDAVGTAVNSPASVPPSTPENYEKALQEYKRYQKLYELGAISRRQLESMEARLQAARQSLSGTETTTPSPRAADVLRTPVIVAAPVDGVVASVVTTGNIVQAGQQVMVLGSGQTVEIVVPLEQQELYSVHLGTPAAIEVADHTLTGQVTSIFPAVQENKIAAFLAHIKLTDPPDGMLKAGMTVKVHIATGL